MEKIILNGIEQKTTKSGKPFWVVAYDLVNGVPNQQATIGEWDKQLAWFLENEVGIRGVVDVELKQKGQYVNITGVLMDGSHTKGSPLTTNTPLVAQQTTSKAIEMTENRDDRQKSIEAQAMTKLLVEFEELTNENWKEKADKTIELFHYVKSKI